MNIDNNYVNIIELLEELLKFRLQHSSGQLKEVHNLKKLKKEIARAKTINKQKL